MRALPDMETIQIEITNACINQCSNCTRLCGHHKKPFFMSLEQFKEAVDSLEDFPNRIGIMGGEPLLHPQFQEICEYLNSKRERMRCGLWTTLPKGKEHYRELIVKTFGCIFLNDHSKEGIMHTPLLVGADEVVHDKDYMWYLIDRCWVQNTWSASITPDGGFFCEVAAAFASLTGDKGWEIGPGWWEKYPKDFQEQMDKYCTRCGAAVPMWRRDSIDGKDDVSPKNLEFLKNVDSPKIRRGQYEIYDKGVAIDTRNMFSFSEIEYRHKIAAKYNIGMLGYVTPYLPEDVEKDEWLAGAIEYQQQRLLGNVENGSATVFRGDST